MSTDPVLLAKLRELTPGYIYTLTKAQVLKRAGESFSDGAVTRFFWQPDGKLRAELGGKHPVEVRIGIDDRQRLAAECTCGWSDVWKDCCVHSVGALMSICYLLRGSTFNNKPPKAGWLKQRTGELLSGGKPQKEADVSGVSYPCLVLRAEESQRRGSLVAKFHATAFGANVEVHQAPPNLRELLLREWGSLDVSKFTAWLATREAEILPVWVQLDGERMERVEQIRPVRVTSSTLIANLGTHIRFSRSAWHEGVQCPMERLVSLGNALWFDVQEKRLCVMDAEGWRVFHDLQKEPIVQSAREARKQRGGTSDAAELDLRLWNHLAVEASWVGEAASHAAVTFAPAWETLPELSPVWEIRITKTENHDGMFYVILHCNVEKENLPYGSHLLGAIEGALTGRVRQTEIDLFYAWAADWLEKDETGRRELEAQLEAAPDLSDEFKRSCLQVRTQWSEFGARNSGARLHAGRETRWFTVNPEIESLPRKLAPILRIGEMRMDRIDYWPVFPVERVSAALPHLVSAAGKLGVAVLYEGSRMREAALDVRVETVKSELDWFELKPHVMYGGELIPAKDWRRMLQEGRWKTPAGEWVVVEADSARTLARIQALLAEHSESSKDKKKEEFRVPRLQMLDWLALRRDGVACDFPEEAERVLHSLLNLTEIPVRAVPKSLQAELRHYQQEGFSWLAFLYEHRFGACLADDMGLGKTIQTIALFAALKEGIVSAPPKQEIGPHLIVLPPTLLFNWRHELERFCPGLKVVDFSPKLAGFDDADVVLISYEMVRRNIDALAAHRFHLVVCDEAQAVKNLAGERSKAMRRLNARFKVCLTGTPLENHAGEYYAIMDLALPGLFGSYETFRKRLREDQDWNILDRARPFVLRRTKEKILSELPPKTESDIYLDPSEEQKAFYTRAVADVRAEIAEAYGEKPAAQAGIVALAALTRLRQICVAPALLDAAQTDSVAPKLEYLTDSLVELRDEGHAALVFSQFTSALDLLETQLEKAGVAYLRIDGTTPMKKRKQIVDSFQDPSGPPVFLISLKTGGAGLNLTRADYVFHIDPWWNPAVENQASDRAHRIGQERPVIIQRLLMRGTVEEKIMVLKERKKELFRQIVEGGAADQALKLKREDFEQLMQ